MRKTIVTLLATAAMTVPFAHAEVTPITVEFQYDSNLLATEAGAKQVLKTIKVQAKDACTYAKPVSGAASFDRACRDDLIKKAISEIRLAAIEEGKAATLVFASLETDAEIVAQ